MNVPGSEIDDAERQGIDPRRYLAIRGMARNPKITHAELMDVWKHRVFLQEYVSARGASHEHVDCMRVAAAGFSITSYFACLRLGYTGADLMSVPADDRFLGSMSLCRAASARLRFEFVDALGRHPGVDGVGYHVAVGAAASIAVAHPELTEDQVAEATRASGRSSLYLLARALGHHHAAAVEMAAVGRDDEPAAILRALAGYEFSPEELERAATPTFSAREYVQARAHGWSHRDAFDMQP